MHTNLEQPEQHVGGRVDIKPLTQPLGLLGVQFLILSIVSAFPVLFLPHRLPHLYVSKSAHEFLPDRVQFPKGDIPHLEDFFGGCDQMQSFVVPVRYVNDRKPSIFVLLGKLELFTVVPGIGSGAQLFDILDRN